METKANFLELAPKVSKHIEAFNELVNSVDTFAAKPHTKDETVGFLRAAFGEVLPFGEKCFYNAGSDDRLNQHLLGMTTKPSLRNSEMCTRILSDSKLIDRNRKAFKDGYYTLSEYVLNRVREVYSEVDESTFFNKHERIVALRRAISKYKGMLWQCDIIDPNEFDWVNADAGHADYLNSSLEELLNLQEPTYVCNFWLYKIEGCYLDRITLMRTFMDYLDTFTKY